MKITMMTIGSTGDVRPFILLGKELQRRGHEITIAAFSTFEKLVRDNGMNFVPIAGDSQEMMSAIMKPGTNGAGYLAQIIRTLGRIAPAVLKSVMEAGKGCDAIVCNFFSSMWYSVAEKYNVPIIQTQLSPLDTNRYVPISSAPGQRLGPVWNRFTYRAGYVLIGLAEKALLTKWRRENGVDVRHIHTHPDYNVNGHTVPVVYAVSPSVLPRDKRWSEHIRMSGYWWEENPEAFTPSPELEAFLAAGEPPVYIGFGSMVSGNMQKTLNAVMEGIRLSGKRVILLRGWGGANADLASNPNVFFADYLPHDWLLPRVKAVVHHGGSGTLGAGLRYGRPTLVVPFGGDQPQWAERCRQLGVGPKPIPRSRLTAKRLSNALIELTENQTYAVNAQRIADEMKNDPGVSGAADIIEKEIAAWIAAD